MVLCVCYIISELKRSYAENKILVLVLEPNGINNFYKNIHSFEFDGKTVELEKTVVLLNIKKENVYKRLDELVDISTTPLLYEKEKNRIERGRLRELIEELKIDGYANVIRDRYFTEGYVKDIVNAIPLLVSFENSKKREMNRLLGTNKPNSKILF